MLALLQAECNAEKSSVYVNAHNGCLTSLQSRLSKMCDYLREDVLASLEKHSGALHTRHG